MNQAEQDVIFHLFGRYEAMVLSNPAKLKDLPTKCNFVHLRSLCNEVFNNGPDYPFDKMCRWLGFVQGVLAVQGIIDVDFERDYTRPLFHKLYGTTVPSFGD